jgi:hypothetical protein
MDRMTIRYVVAFVAALTLVWVAMVVYVGERAMGVFHVGFTSCLPDDFPKYPRAAISSIVVSDVYGNCTIQFQTRDSSEEVKDFFETNLDEGDWVVTAVSDQAGQIQFSRDSDPNVQGYVQVIGIPGQTQFQIQIRTG